MVYDTAQNETVRDLASYPTEIPGSMSNGTKQIKTNLEPLAGSPHPFHNSTSWKRRCIDKICN